MRTSMGFKKCPRAYARVGSGFHRAGFAMVGSPQRFSLSGLRPAPLQQLAIRHALVSLHVDLGFLVGL